MIPSKLKINSKIKQYSLNNQEEALADILSSSRKRQEHNNGSASRTETTANNINEASPVTTVKIEASTCIPSNEFNFMNPIAETADLNQFSFMSPNIVEHDSIETQKQISIEKSSNLKGLLFSKNVNATKEKSLALASDKSAYLKTLFNINHVNSPSIEKISSLKETILSIDNTTKTIASKDSNQQKSKSNKKVNNNSKPASSSKFASSKLVQSPDPLTMPLPDFDESFFG